MLKGLKGRTAILNAVGQREVLIDADTGGDENGKLLTVVLRADQVAGTQNLVKAEIQFGSDGFQTSAIVDFLNGYAFAVAASKIRVIAFELANFGPTRIGAFVVEGASGDDSLAMANLIPAFPGTVTLGIGATQTITLPAYVKKVKVFSRRPEADSYAVEMYYAGPAGPASEILAGAGKLSTMDWQEILTPVTSLRIKNTGPAAISNLSAWGALKLG